MDHARADWLALRRLERMAAEMRRQDQRLGLARLAEIQDAGGKAPATYRWFCNAEYRGETPRVGNVAPKCTVG